MTEQEVLKKIKESAEGIEIPVTLGPEEIRKMLDRKTVQTPSFCWQGEETEQRERSGGTKRRILKSSAAVAAILLAAGISGAGLMHLQHFGRTLAGGGYALTAFPDTEEKETGGDNSESGIKPVQIPKQDAGNLYTVAQSYEEVYALLEKESAVRYNYSYDTGGAALQEAAIAEEEIPVYFNEAVKSASDSASNVRGSLDYSKTNLQTEGVDESDLIKTNGSYIFTVSDDRVVITDVRNGQMEPAGEINPELNSAADDVLEMYVDDGHLLLIVQELETYLQENQLYGEDEDGEIQNGETKSGGMLPVEDCAYLIESKCSTVIYTYDIADPKAPKLSGITKQDGSYRTSRKIGDIVYLFTDQGLLGAANRVTKMEQADGCFLPLVNGEQLSYDCIYLPERGDDGLIVSSIDIKNPGSVIDKTMIVNNYVKIYVSTEALYLYNTDYSADKTVTQIAKFTLKDGMMNAAGAASVDGGVLDTFAINENGSKLRILTTGRNNGTDSNNLYLLNEKLELTGSLTGIASGEQIYAARYFGDMAYFITYRNTDPLFAVDLSDEKNPKVLSELKVTGFSEYLHPWGEDKLLGIGYETDPNTGIQMGIKLIMFDISNPADLQELSSLVIQNADYSPALYNYKCVTAEKNANIAGFAVIDYDIRATENGTSYLVFSWEGDHFENRLTTPLDTTYGGGDYRGIYIGERFYLVSPKEIVSFDRADGYRELQKISL